MAERRAYGQIVVGTGVGVGRKCCRKSEALERAVHVADSVLVNK